MLNSKETLKKLHKRFPLMSLDELFDILDCYVETSPYFAPNLLDKVYYSTTNNLSTSKPENCLITKTNYSNDAISSINTAGNIQLAASN